MPFCRLLLDLVRRRSIIQPLRDQEEHWSIELVTTDDALFNFQRLPDSLRVYEHEREYTARGLAMSRTSVLYLAIRPGSHSLCNFS